MLYVEMDENYIRYACEKFDISPSFFQAIRDMPGVKRTYIGMNPVFEGRCIHIQIVTENGAYFKRSMELFMIRSDQEAALKFIKLWVDEWMAKENPYLKKSK